MKTLQTLLTWLVLIWAGAACSSTNASHADTACETDEAGSGGRSRCGAAESAAGESNQAGNSGMPACPPDIVAAEGESCAAFGEGFECFDARTGPCEFGHAVLCANRVWVRRESLPAPCNGTEDGVGG
jgi:hypothetical protein